LHQAGIGVILDWYPTSRWCARFRFLRWFQFFEHPDRKKGYHPDWKSLVFNYGRNEVMFLISVLFCYNIIRTDLQMQ
jgi:1,4-alpha-glucan branching enzyme